MIDAESCKLIDQTIFALLRNDNFCYVVLEERLFLKWVELPVLIVISVISENSMLRLYSLQRLKRAENKCICRFESIFVVQNLIQSDLIILAD